MIETFDNVRRDFVAQNTAAVESNNPLLEAVRLEKIHGVDNVWNTIGLQDNLKCTVLCLLFAPLRANQTAQKVAWSFKTVRDFTLALSQINS